MFKSFYPSEWIDSTYDIDFKALKEKGYKGVVFDVDNTLVCHGAPQNEQSLKLINSLKEMGYGVLFLSNNKEPRVKSFNEAVNCQYIFKAGKPNPRNYLKACEMLGTNKDNTLFVGDQLFTDVWGANKAGLFSILVKPIDKHEEIQIILKRKLEWFVLRAYKRKLRKEGKMK